MLAAAAKAISASMALCASQPAKLIASVVWVEQNGARWRNSAGPRDAATAAIRGALLVASHASHRMAPAMRPLLVAAALPGNNIDAPRAAPRLMAARRDRSHPVIGNEFGSGGRKLWDY